jgi:hypothetical protein
MPVQHHIAPLPFWQSDDCGLGDHAVGPDGDAAAFSADARVRVDYGVFCDFDGVGSDDGGFVSDDGGGVNGAWWAFYGEGVGCYC